MAVVTEVTGIDCSGVNSAAKGRRRVGNDKGNLSGEPQ